jgi:hypothetical protein
MPDNIFLTMLKTSIMLNDLCPGTPNNPHPQGT